MKPEVCDSRDLFVLENSLKQLILVIALISRPHQVNLTGINMFKRHIDEFSKKSQKKRFLKMRKTSTSRENSNGGCLSKPQGPL